MGRARHQLTIRIPIPSQIPAAKVVDALQCHSPMIRHQALVTRFQRRPVALESIVNDSFFVSDGTKISQFDIYERITFVPGVAHKEISFPVVFQSVRDGVRCRADAPAGVRLWSEYRVERRKADSPDGAAALASTAGYAGFANGDDVYELVEEVVVEANSMLMPFVSRSMEGAHRDICQKVLDEVQEQMRRLRPETGHSSHSWS